MTHQPKPCNRFFVMAVCILFLLSGCSPSKNMLAAIFGGDIDRPDSGQTATDDPILVDPDAGFRLARHFQKSGRHRLAVDELLKVVRADPAHAGAYNALGVSYDRLREFDLAGGAYREALQIDPNLDYVYNNIGYSNLLQGKLEAAATAFETAVALKSEKAIYQNNLALAYARLGKDPAAQPAAAATAAAPITAPTAAPTAAATAVVAAAPKDLTTPAPALFPIIRPEPAAPAAVRADDDSRAAAVTVMDLPAAGDVQAAAATETDILTAEEIAQAAAAEPKHSEAYYTIQLGVYYDLADAHRALQAARENGLADPYITQVDRGQGFVPYYRVRAGKYESRSRAEHLAAGIRTDAPMAAFAVMETGVPQVLHAVADSSPARHEETLMVSSRDKLPVIIQTNRDIEILNGNGVRHMAREFQQYLADRGIEVDHIANAAHFRHPKTIIYYSPGYYGQAKQLLAEIQKVEPAGRMVKSRHMDRKIRIVLGRDIMDAAENLGQKS